MDLSVCLLDRQKYILAAWVTAQPLNWLTTCLTASLTHCLFAVWLTDWLTNYLRKWHRLTAEIQARFSIDENDEYLIQSSAWETDKMTGQLTDQQTTLPAT